jgi:hypothetical protein
MRLVPLTPLLSLGIATAYPPTPLYFKTPPSTDLSLRSSPPTAVSILLQIAPSSSSCASAPIASECSTAEHAAPYLIGAMSTYNVSYPSELAALLSLIAFETSNFQYAINHFPAPGRPGQGTRNMQMANYNLMYARSIPALGAQLDSITTGNTVDGLSDDDLNAIRALVLPDEYAWGSAAWFLESQCGADVRNQLQQEGAAGWEAYLGCIGTDATDDRKAVWERACTAFGISSL